MTVEGRCPIDPEAPNAWGPGDLDRMFTKLTNEPYLSKHSVQILSSPEMTGGPWVISMDDVVLEQEAQRLIELGATEGFERSADVGRMKEDGNHEPKVSDSRTSRNAWCLEDCYQDEMAQAVIHRLSDLTGIDETNSEHLQILKYEQGEYYKSLHDYIDFQMKRYVHLTNGRVMPCHRWLTERFFSP
jgi:prolyl 4-hydroxylase